MGDRTIAFASTFACFLTRAFDNLRMGVISQTNLNVMGSHCGVSIGEDGPSQMALEDLAMFQSLPGCTVFYPSDAVAMERAVELAANTRGVTFLRAGRPAVPVLYNNDETFQVGKAKIVKEAEGDQVLVIGAGITLVEAIKAAETLAETGVKVRVMDPFTVKPLDWEAVQKHAHACGGRVVTVEDHYPEGGLGDSVLACLAQVRNTVVKKLRERCPEIRSPHGVAGNVRYLRLSHRQSLQRHPEAVKAWNRYSPFGVSSLQLMLPEKQLFRIVIFYLQIQRMHLFS